MDRRHLRTKDGIFLCLHLFSKESSLIICRPDITYVIFFITDSDSSDEGSYSDTCGTEVIDLIYLKHCIDLIRSCQNVFDLVNSHSIQSASKGIELYKVNVFSVFYKFRSSVKSRMVHPLVCDYGRTFYLSEMRYRVFGKHRKIVAGDKFRNSMVDLRVNMIRSSRKNYSAMSGVLHPANGFLTLFLHILMGTFQFEPCLVSSSPDFFFSNIPGLKLFYYLIFGKFTYRSDGMLDLVSVDKYPDQLIRTDFLIRKSKEWLHKHNRVIFQTFNIILDVFRIGSNHRTVIMISCFRCFISLIRYARIEYEFLSVSYEPLHMSVNDLGRVALGFRRNALYTQLINLSGTCRREDSPELKLSEKCCPERIVLIHVENPRYTHFTTRCDILRQRFIVEHSLKLIFVKIRNIPLDLCFSETSFTAVS